MGLLQHRSLLQKLENIPGTVQRVFTIILKDFKGLDVLALLEDTSIAITTEEDNLTSSASILGTALEARGRLKFSMCSFGVGATEIPGHTFSVEGLRLLDKHVECIRELMVPIF